MTAKAGTLGIAIDGAHLIGVPTPNEAEWSGSPGFSIQTLFAITSGALPPGVTLAQKAVGTGTTNQFGWSGIPEAVGVYTVDVGPSGTYGGDTFVWTIALVGGCPTINILPASLPDGLLRQPYTYALSGDAGVAPFAFDVIAGALPAGLTISAAGLISGAPTAGGVFSFTVRLIDDNGCTAVRAYTITISGLLIKIDGEDVTIHVAAADLELGLNRQATGELELDDEYLPDRGADVLIYARDGTTPIFGGIVLSRRVMGMTPSNPANRTRADLVDYSVFFDDADPITIVSAVSQDLEDVIASIVAQSLAVFGLTYDEAPTGITVPPIEWTAINVSDAFKRITDATGVVFRVDPLKAIKVFAPLDDPAPVTITDANINAFDLEWSDPPGLAKNQVDLACGPTGNGVATQEWEVDSGEISWEVDIQAVLGDAQPARRANAYLSPVGATNFSDGDTIGAGSSTYTFRTALVGDVAGEVLIGATVEDSINNLNAAINLAGGGVYAPSTAANTDVSSYIRNPGQLEADALATGAAGNAITVTSSNEPIAFWYGEGGVARGTLQLGADATAAGGWTQGYILEDGGVQRSLSPIPGAATYRWDVTDGRGTVSVDLGPAPAEGTILELKHLAVFPFHAIAPPGGASPPRTFRENHPEIVEYAEGLALAAQILLREEADRRELEVFTDVDGFVPGQALDVDTSHRYDIDATFLVATVRIKLVNAELWEYSITNQQTDEYAGTYVDQWKALTSGGGSAAAPATIDGGAAIAGDIYSDGRNAFHGDQSMGGNRLTSVDDPVAAQDAATKAYVDAAAPAGVILADGSVPFAADESMGGFNLQDVADPANAQDAATKAYVDAAMDAGFAIAAANVATAEATSSTSYADLTTPGPSVTVVTGTTAIVFLSGNAAKTGSGNTAFLSVAVSGATTIAAADGNAAHQSEAISTGDNSIARVVFLSGLTPGPNTFTLRYRVDGGTWTFQRRSIAVAYLAGNRAALAAAALAARIAMRF